MEKKIAVYGGAFDPLTVAHEAIIEYLLENYGLAVNTRDYYIRYDAFASNQPPSVRVEEKETGAHPS